MSALKRPSGALDYREDEDQVAPDAKPVRKKALYRTPIPVLVHPYLYGIDLVPNCIPQLERLINRVLYQKTNGTEVIQLQLDSLNTGTIYPGTEQQLGALQYIDHLTEQVIEDSYYASSSAKRKKKLEEKKFNLATVGTSPLLILKDNKQYQFVEARTSVHNINGIYPFAKVIMIHMNDIKPDRWDEGSELAKKVRYPSADLLKSSVTNELVPFEWIRAAEDGSYQQVFERSKQKVESARTEARSMIDPEFSDNPYVYPHVPSSIPTLAQELLARSVSLDITMTSGIFVNTPHQFEETIDHLVTWIMNYSTIRDRHQHKVLDRDTDYPHVIGKLIDQYAQGPPSYTKSDEFV